MLEHLILNGRIEAAYHYYDQAPRNYKEQLISHFQKGKRKEFMKLFALLKSQEKLEFYIRVYFLIYSIHPALKAKPSIPEEQVNAFRQYLDTKGADLAKTNQFLQFYALSFVKKPLEHPSYKVLFKKQWIANLTQKLNIFLMNEDRRMRELVQKSQTQSKMRSPQFAQPSQIVSNSNIKAVEEKNKKLFEEVQSFRNRYHELERNNQALIESFNNHLMESQHKWFQITRELTNNSKTLVDLISKSNSNLIYDRRYQRVKKRTEKFEKFVKKELDELLNQSQDISVFDKPSNNEISYSASATPNVSQRNITTYVTIDEFVPTNYVTLIRDFKKMSDNQKIQVLQGLSWRIIKSKNKWIRRQTIIGLIVNDVLGLVNGDIQILLFNKNLMIHVVKLFLFISQDSYGKKVLFRNGGLYKELVDLIPETVNNKEYLCLSMVLQILLNIWHNRDIYTELINLNIIDICINVLLQDKDIVADDDILESIVTLLVNASLTDEGLDSFQYQVDVFYYLCQAFKEANDTIRNLIGAIIYSLLGRKNLWKLAHEAKLPSFIDDLIKIDQRSNKQQLKLIQSKLHSFKPGQTLDQNDLNDDESADSNMEEQNFQRNEQELIELEQYIKAHDMMAAKYGLKNKQAQKQIEEINKIMNQHKRITDVVADFPEAKTDGKSEREVRVEKMSQVRLPEIKKKKEHVEIYNPKTKGEPVHNKQYYTYKSPNVKITSQKKNVVSMQVEAYDSFRQGSLEKKSFNSFEHQLSEQKRINRVQTSKPSEPLKDIAKKQQKKKPEKKSAEKPEYRIKKSSSVDKGLGNPYKKELAYETNKNSSNVAQFKSIEGVKSPPQKKSRDQVLRQLNQELRAQKRAVVQERVQERKISSKYIEEQRQNTHLKKNNFTGPTEQLRAFQSKPKIRRTPPKDDE